MLIKILHEIKSSKEPISLPALSNRLGIERGALEGMLMYWENRGHLYEGATQSNAAKKSKSCGCSCTGAESCPYMAKMPKTYSLPFEDR